jgi:hypothetical protein
LNDFRGKILERLFPNFGVVLEREFWELKQCNLTLHQYSRRHRLLVEQLARPLESYKLKFIQGLNDGILRIDLAKSNYTKMSHDAVCSLASSQLHSHPVSCSSDYGATSGLALGYAGQVCHEGGIWDPGPGHGLDADNIIEQRLKALKVPRSRMRELGD